MSRSVLGILFICTLLGVAPCYSAETPEEFAQHLISAMNNKDRNAYVALIHPASKEYYEKNNPEIFEKRVGYVLSSKPLSQYSSYETVITDIENEQNYNKDKNAIRVWRRLAIFPVAPSKILTIRVTEKTETEVWESPRVTQALSQLNSKWYMIWPTEYIDYDPTDE